MRSANNWLAFSLSPHLTIDAPDHAPTSQSNGQKVARHSSAENGMAYNGSASSEFYNPGQSEDDGLPMRSDGSLCIMEALSRSHSGDWAQLKTGHVQRSQHLLNNELSRLAGRAPSEQQISQNQYDSINKSSDHETVPKLEDFLGGATSLGGQYSTRSDSQSHNFDNLYFRDINVNLSPYSGGAQQQQQQQSSHVPPSFHAYGLQRTDNSSSQQPYDSHSRTNTAAATAAEPNLCHPNVHAQNMLQVALEQHRHPGSGTQGGEILGDCTRQLPQGPNLSALKTWLQQSQAAAPSPGVNALGSAGGDKQPVGIGKASIPSLANLHQSLSLSMSPGSQSSNTLQVGAQQAVQPETSPETRKRGPGRAGSKEASPRKSIDNFGQRTSVFRGVTRHRWTGRYEAHLWDNSCRKEGQTRKGRQVYLGGYDKEEKAARAYDLAALKYWGANTTINFPLHQYEKEVEEMKNMTRQEYVASLRRKSSGFSRGASVYRGVTRHHQHGRWQARIGRVAGNKDLYLGTYSTQEEAAEAYDIAAIKFRGINAVTNFDISRYDTKRICGTAHNTATGDNNETPAAAVVANINKLPLPITNPASNYGHVVSAKELQLVVLPEQQQQQQRSEVSVDQTEEDSQSLQTGNTSQATDGGLVVSRPSHLQEWQMLYQQQAQRSWDDTSSVQQHQPQHHQQPHHHHQQQHDPRTQSLVSMSDSKYQQQQDVRTQSLISITDSKFQQQQDARTQSLMSITDSKYQQQDLRTSSLLSMAESKFQQQQQHQQQQDVRTQSLMSIADSKFLPSANMHSAVLRNLMGLSDGGGAHSVTETSGGLMAMPGSGHGSSNLIGSTGHVGYSGTQQSPKNNSQLSLRESEDDSSKNSGGGSAYENVMPGDFSRHIMYMSHKQSPPHGSQNSSVTNAGYDSNSLGASSWVSPQAGLNGRVNLSVGQMPIFAVWNE